MRAPDGYSYCQGIKQAQGVPEPSDWGVLRGEEQHGVQRTGVSRSIKCATMTEACGN